MTTSYGVTLQGFVPKTLADLKTELEDALRAVFGNDIDVSPESNFGQLIGVFAERYSQLWSVGEEIEASYSPDNAVGASLDAVCALTGTTRAPATYSTVPLVLTGTAGTVVGAGKVATNSSASVRFATDASATIAAAAAWTATTAYAAGDFVKNGGNIYRCTFGGTSAGAGGPTGTSTSIGDNTVVWDYMGAGTGAVLTLGTSETTGPKEALAYTLNSIATPVAGWSNVMNPSDATPGTDQETDAALRLRREQELRGNGKASVEAIRAALLLVADVTVAAVFENTSDATDGFGITPNSIECLVLGGAEADIEEAIFNAKAAGIATCGTTSGIVTDSQGVIHTVSFSRPTEKNVYVEVALTIDDDYYPADGDTLIKAAIVAWGDAQSVGKDVVASALEAQCFTVAGVLDATCYIGLAPAPATRTTISISTHQIAAYDTGRISVTSTPGTP